MGRLIYLKGRVIGWAGWGEKERERERENLVLLVHSPNGSNNQSCIGLKPGVRRFFWVSSTKAILQCFARYISMELGGKWRSWVVKWCPGSSFTCLATSGKFLPFIYRIQFMASLRHV